MTEVVRVTTTYLRVLNLCALPWLLYFGDRRSLQSVQTSFVPSCRGW